MKPNSFTQRSSSVAADETELLHAALQFRDAVRRPHARGLQQLSYADEVPGIEPAHPVDQLIAGLRPVLAGALVADVVAHPHGTRREDGEIRPALALNPELDIFETFPDLI